MKPSTNPRVIFFGLSSFQALAMFRRGIFYTFLGVYLRSYLGLSVTETTLFETIPMVLNIVFQTFIWGRLADRLQLRRSLIVAGEILAGVGHLVLWLVHARCQDPRAAGWAIIWGLTVIEVFWSMSNIGWSAFISDVYGEAERNAVQGRLASVGGLGRIVGIAIGGLLYDGAGRAFPGWGYQAGGIFFVAAVAMLASTVPLLFLPEGGVSYRGGSGDAPSAASGTAIGGRGGDFRTFAVFLVAVLLINSGINSLATFKAQFLDLPEPFGASAGAISLVMNVESAALILVGFFIGVLGRRLGIPLLLVAGTLSGMASLVLYAVSPSLGPIFAASAFKGFSDGAIASASYAYASTLIPPDKRGRYFAAYNATFMLSWGLSATLVTGPLIDRLMKAGRPVAYAYRAGIYSSAAIMALGLSLLLALFARRRSPARA